MILVFYFVVGSHFGFLRLLFCSEFGGTLLDGFVFCREPFSTKSPVSTSAPNGQGDTTFTFQTDSIPFSFLVADLTIFVYRPQDALGALGALVQLQI